MGKTGEKERQKERAKQREREGGSQECTSRSPEKGPLRCKDGRRRAGGAGGGEANRTPNARAIHTSTLGYGMPRLKRRYGEV